MVWRLKNEVRQPMRKDVSRELTHRQVAESCGVRVPYIAGDDNVLAFRVPPPERLQAGGIAVPTRPLAFDGRGFARCRCQDEVDLVPLFAPPVPDRRAADVGVELVEHHVLPEHAKLVSARVFPPAMVGHEACRVSYGLTRRNSTCV